MNKNKYFIVHLSFVYRFIVHSDVAMNAWPPQASYPCGNFSDTSCIKLRSIFKWWSKGSIGLAFAVCIRTEKADQASFYPFALRKVSVHPELTLGHLRYHLTDVPPQSNSPSVNVLGCDWSPPCGRLREMQEKRLSWESLTHHDRVSRETTRVVVFHFRRQRRLPLMLHLSCLSTITNWSQAQQGLLSPLFRAGPFPCLLVR